MQIYFITAEHVKFDGGACFGVVPKTLWSKIYPPDENNMVAFALRNLLVVENGRKILFDTGVGNKQDEKFRSHFLLHGQDNLVNALRDHGLSPDDITDVVHTHLHFDHCGGTSRRNENNETVPVFKNAELWCSLGQWNWANNPNPREKASYLEENLLPMQQSGKLNFVRNETRFTENIFLKMVNGHTDGQLIPVITYHGRTLVFMADFIPTAAHVSLPYIAGYDTRPLLSMEEKQNFLAEAAGKQYLLVFQHDAIYECCTVQQTEKGVKVKEKGRLADFL
ncbi:MAG TPA: MBL fold metallo-hydrolase [Bacteroidales bacterium]|nr:MBL fold metallo-hydrolase [Bacteroidales bacterium]HQI71002.1 MBL fold metallo-hydrolase [Bacteroidales bacterium]